LLGIVDPYLTFKGLTFEHDNFTVAQYVSSSQPGGYQCARQDSGVSAAVSCQGCQNVTFETSLRKPPPAASRSSPQQQIPLPTGTMFKIVGFTTLAVWVSASASGADDRYAVEYSPQHSRQP